jgi:hypothetical protein
MSSPHHVLSSLVSSANLDLSPLQALAPREPRKRCLQRYLSLAGQDPHAALDRIRDSLLWARRYTSMERLGRSPRDVLGCDPARLEKYFVVSPLLARGPGRLMSALYRFHNCSLPNALAAASLEDIFCYHFWLRRRQVELMAKVPEMGHQPPPLRVIIDLSGAAADGWIARPSADILSLLRRIIRVERQHCPGLIHSVLLVNVPPLLVLAWSGWRLLLGLPRSPRLRMYGPNDVSWSEGMTVPGGMEHWTSSVNSIAANSWGGHGRFFWALLCSLLLSFGTFLRSLLQLKQAADFAADGNAVPLLHDFELDLLRPLSARRLSRRFSSSFSTGPPPGDALNSTALSGAEVSVRMEGPTEAADAAVNSLDTLSVVLSPAEGRTWKLKRRVFEFVSLRGRLVAQGILMRSEPWDRGGKLWDLPPTLKGQALARGMDVFLRAVLTDSKAIGSMEVTNFLGKVTAYPAPADVATVAAVGSEMGGDFPDDDTTGGHFFGDEEEEANGFQSIARPVRHVGEQGTIGDIGSTSYASFRVRSKSYLADRKKQSSLSALMRLESALVLSVPPAEMRVDHICSRGAAAAELRRITSGSNPPFVFVMNFQVPPPASFGPLVRQVSSHSASSSNGGVEVGSDWNSCSDEQGNGNHSADALPSHIGSPSSGRGAMSLVLYFVLDTPWEELSDAAQELIIRYCDVDGLGRPPAQSFQEERLKVIPVVRQGSWVVRKAVSSGRPSLIGRHTTLRLYAGPCYMETAIDVGASALARGAVQALTSSLSSVTVDIAILLEARETPLLPERLLAAFQMMQCDPKEALALDVYRPLLAATSGSGSLCADERTMFVGLPHLRPCLRSMFADPSADIVLMSGGREPFGRLLHCEVFRWQVDAPGQRFEHAAQRAEPILNALRTSVRSQMGAGSGTFFILNFQFPVPELGGGLSIVCFWDLSTPSPVELEMERIGDRDLDSLRRIQRFLRRPRRGGVPDEVRRIVGEMKLNIHVREGPWAIKRVAGGATGVWLRPANHLPMTAHWGDGYMEVGAVADVAALGALPSTLSAAGAACTALRKPGAISADVSVFLPHEDEEAEAHEVLLGCVRLHHIDFTKVEPLGDGEGELFGDPDSPFRMPPVGPSAIFFADASHRGPWTLRGPTYLMDKKKMDAGAPLGKMLRGELFRSKDLRDGKGDHVASYGRANAAVQALLARMASERPGTSPFLFIFNLQVPASDPFNIVCYLGIPSINPADWPDPDEARFVQLLQRFASVPADNDPDNRDPGNLPASDFRNERFKLIPRVRSAPWAVQAAVGSKPVLLGRRLTQRYFTGPGYLELCIDVGSNAIAKNVVGLCTKASKLLVCDLAITIEGRQESELPEKLIGVFTIDSVDTGILCDL